MPNRPVLAYRKVVESLPHLVWTCDGAGQCDYLSSQWVAYTGIPAEDQVGTRWLERLHPDDQEIAQQRWAAAAEAQAPFDTEFRIQRHDGVYRWFKTRAVPEVEAGRIVAWFGTNTDIQDLYDVKESKARLARGLEERVEAQTRALRAANERLETVAIQLETAQRITRVGSWEFDLPSGEVVWSDELFRVFGIAPVEGAPSYDQQEKLFTAESWARLTTAVEAAATKGEPYELILTAIDASGGHRKTIARAEAILRADDRIERLVGTFQDITDREEAAEALRRVSERLQLATRAARIGVWDWNLTDGSLVWDMTMHEIFGTDPDGFDGYETWRATVHSEDLAETERQLQEAVDRKAEFRTVFRIHRKGEVRYIRAEADVTCDAEGRVIRVAGVNQDVTEPRVAEMTLRRAEALQRGILEAAGLAVVVTDLEGTITQINPATELLLGYASQELVGESPGLFHDPIEVDTRRKHLEDELGVNIEAPFQTFVIKTHMGGPDAHEWTYIRKDGSRVPVWLVVSAIRDRDEVVGYLGVAADLTDRKRQEAELVSLNQLLARRSDDAEAASHAKSRFLANMSHEIRTPIGAITGGTYLLGRTPLGEEQRDHVVTIDRAARTLLAMVNDVLDLSKIEAGKLDLDIGPFSLADLTEDLAGLMTALAGDKPLELVVEVDPVLPDRFLGDRVRLMQVLVNLTSNAIKFTSAGSVRVSVSQSDDRIRFDVHDTGMGMDSRLQERVFQAFTQADTPGSHTGGTGLGLAIVQELVNLMGGEIGLSSVPGEGTHVWFEVPLERSTVARTPMPRTRRRVLVAVGQEAQRRTVQSNAMALGWEVSLALSGADAIARFARQSALEQPFDTVLLDRFLPDLDAMATLEGCFATPGAPRPTTMLLAGGETHEALQSDPRAVLIDVILDDAVSSSVLYDAAVRAIVMRDGTDALGNMEPIPPEVQRLPGIRALVVDDSDVNRKIARRILELEGATVYEAANGQEAVEHATRCAGDVDIVLMDVQMPILDGVEASRQILGDPACRDLPIVAMTAGVFSSERERALGAGMADFIPKPYDPEDLITKVRAHVSRARGKQLGVASRREPTVASAPNWPAIEGIDTDDARTRLGGDLPLFRMLLGSLQSDLDEAVASDLLTGERSVIGPWLHKLRGTAGNLGARDLHRLVTEAERALRGGDETRFAVAMEALRLEIDRLRRDVRIAHVSAPPLPGSDETATLDDGTLARVLDLLAEQSLSVTDTIDALSGALAHRLGQRDFGKLQTALANLDFSAARQILAPLVAGSSE